MTVEETRQKLIDWAENAPKPLLLLFAAFLAILPAVASQLPKLLGIGDG